MHVYFERVGVKGHIAALRARRCLFLKVQPAHVRIQSEGRVLLLLTVRARKLVVPHAVLLHHMVLPRKPAVKPLIALCARVHEFLGVVLLPVQPQPSCVHKCPATIGARQILTAAMTADVREQVELGTKQSTAYVAEVARKVILYVVHQRSTGFRGDRRVAHETRVFHFFPGDA